jgi:eukaryotic-like serine/threonine-protein kinase
MSHAAIAIKLLCFMNKDAEPDDNSFTDEDALLAEAFDKSLVEKQPIPNEFSLKHGELASVFRLLHNALGRQSQSAPLMDCEDESFAISILPSRFRILAVVGQGGFGKVYRAHDELLNRDVAIKVLPQQLVECDGELSQDLSEPRAVARLSHPNIVPLYEIISDGQTLCLISEFCQGPTLSVWLEEHGDAVSAKLAAEIALQLSEAVAHAHGRGIVHRDIKPANVMLVPKEDRHSPLDFSPKLTDFGLIRDLLAPDVATAKVIVGTLEYMAPEQISGAGQVGEATSDVYSLGVLLYRMLAGRLPHSGTTPLELMSNICTDLPRRLRSINPRIPRDLESIAMKCLSTLPSGRYATAQGLVDDLRLWKSGNSVLARPRSAWEQVLQVARRSPIAAALIAVIICLVTAATIMLGRSNEQLTKQHKQLHSALVDARRSEQLALQSEQKASLAMHEALQRRQEAVSHRKLATMAAYNADLPRGFEAIQRREFSAAGKIVAEIERYCDTIIPLATDFRILQALSKQSSFVAGHDGEVHEILINLQQHSAVSAGEGGILRFRDLNSGQVTREICIGTNCSIHALACSADGKRLAIGYAQDLQDNPDSFRNAVTIIDWETSRELQLLDGFPSTVESLTFSPIADRLAIGCRYESVVIQSLQNLEDVLTLESNRRNDEVLWSPDGAEVVIFNAPHQLRRYDSHSGNVLQAVDRAGQPHHVAYSPDGRWIALSYFHRPEIEFLDAKNLNLVVHRLAQSLGGTQRISYSPSGRYLVAGLRNGGIVSWDLERLNNLDDDGATASISGLAHEQQILTHSGCVSAVAITDENRVLSGSEDGSVAYSDFRPRFAELLETDGKSVSIARISPSGKSVFMGFANGSLSTLDLTSGKLETWVDARTHALTKLVVAPDSGRLAVGWANGDVALLALPSFSVLCEQKAVTSPPATRSVLNDLQMDATGERLAILRDSQTIEVWNDLSAQAFDRSKALDASPHTSHTTLRQSDAIAFGFSPDVILYGGLSNDLRSVNPMEGVEQVLFTGRQLLRTLCLDHQNAVAYCGYADGRIDARSPSGKILAQAAHTLSPLDPTQDSIDVTTLAVSPDGCNLFSGTREGEVRIWSIPDLVFRGQLHARDGKGAIVGINFSSNGKRMLIQQARADGMRGTGTFIIEMP